MYRCAKANNLHHWLGISKFTLNPNFIIIIIYNDYLLIDKSFMRIQT